MKNILLNLLLIGSIAMAGCGRSEARPDPGKKKVVATTAMVGDIAREIAGDSIDLVILMGPGVDPHLYKPTVDDLRQLRSADLILYNGMHLEGKMTETFTAMAGSRRVVPIAERVDRNVSGYDDADHDPHAWMDVSIWAQTINVVRDELSSLAPERASEFGASAERFRNELTALHAYGKAAVATIPESSRLLITSHDAFGYFGAAYGIDVLAVQGLSTEDEASLRHVNEIVKTIVSRNVKAVFVETSVSDRGVRSLIEGAKNAGHDVTIGGQLFSDAMGTPGTYEGTYVGMLDHNITTIVRSLGGDAPEAGLNGKLSHANAR